MMEDRIWIQYGPLVIFDIVTTYSVWHDEINHPIFSIILKKSTNPVLEWTRNKTSEAP